MLLDIWMPQIDGIDLLKQIKGKQPAINVVMISGHGNIHTAVDGDQIRGVRFSSRSRSR